MARDGGIHSAMEVRGGQDHVPLSSSSPLAHGSEVEVGRTVSSAMETHTQRAGLGEALNEEARKSTGSLASSLKSTGKKMSKVRKAMSLRSLGDGLKGVLSSLPHSKKDKGKEKEVGGVAL